MLGKVKQALRRLNNVASPGAQPAPDVAAVAPASCVDIAIIGLSGRYPMANDVNQFWQNLKNGKDCITEVPAERWDHSLYFDPDKSRADTTYSKWGGFIDGIEQFDPLFFNISPREAERMDPQERLFLQCVYEAIEDAGYKHSDGGLCASKGKGADNKIGVYAGVMFQEYQLYGAQQQTLGNNMALPGNSANVANRVSYYFDFRGPSIALDTMCSSSLTSVHLACQSIQAGESELAIAGGVNLSVHPNKYLVLGQGKFVSGKGQCQAFGEGGDGYVPSEGVGAIILKPLARAIADGDHIYGVIKGTAINHGGKGNGYSGPNPTSQANVIDSALQQAGVDPRAISYIEAHGTGTSLGDPIEIAGLAKTFRKYTSDKGFCPIGSSKSNIGHCESAAGIAGLTKVLLQLKHKQLAPSLHSAKLNRYIDFANSPFVVQQELAEWVRPVLETEAGAVEYPRIAGISSFGAGGTNAHVIIEEYVPVVEAAHQQQAALIVLSAKNEERLREQAQRLLAALEGGAFNDADLRSIAYTLQVGREAMNERFALVANGIDDLKAKLEAFVIKNAVVKECYRGQVKGNKDAVGVFAADDELTAAVEAWVAKGKYGKLLELWVKGLVFDWAKSYGANKPKRISLPTYPFAKERYWAPDHGVAAAAAPSSLLHPLLHRNTSDLSGPRFSTTLAGESFFLADHVVLGRRVLPGVAYLEMALAGVMQASGLPDASTVQLADVVWLRPLAVEGAALEVHLFLYPEDNGAIAFEVGGDGQVYSQGVARVGAAGVAGQLDIAALQSECVRKMTAHECYALFAGAGLAYGPRFQALQGLHIGDGQVLAKLAMPANAAGAFLLHPSMIDGALQASLGLLAGDAGGKAAIPFALGELTVLGPCTANMWALVRRSAGSGAADKVQRLDIDVCNDAGAVCVRLTGLSLRVLGSDPAAVAPAAVVAQVREATLVSASPDQLQARAQAYFKKLLSAALKLPAQQIDADAPLEKYGIDSVMVMKLSEELEGAFGPLSKTLFFEYQSIEEISGYFIASHREQLDRLLGVQASVPQAATAEPPVPEAAPALRTRARSRFAAGPQAQAVTHEAMEVAIIGVAGRYPQAIDIEAFWQNLKNGRDCITEIPADRWDYKLYFNTDKNQPGTTCSKWGGFIEGVDEFDPLFFNISPRDAEIIDPQERLFLQCVYGALEDSGYTKETLGSASVGVFAGAMYEEYQLYGAQEQAQGRAIALSGSAASIANRISYYCNFQGPSMTLDTMCSSSLTAIHLACDSLQRGGCELAFAGGVNVSIHPNKYLVLGQGKFASSKGHCESFGEGGDGYVPGEGVGVLLLKPKARAIADGDHIYGIVKGTAINHGGKTNGYTVPNPNAQASVISRALKEARVDPRTVSYIEAHGTGTSLGDPIEIAGLNKAFRQSTADTQFCAIGSAKSNIGHCESAAGIAGVTKVLLQMRHRQLAPSLHSTVLNPNIDFTSSPFSVQQELAEWKRPVVNGVEYPRIAGISSFGAGGSNAHVVLEEYVAAPRTPVAGDAPALVVLSARTAERLQERVQQLLAWLGREDANLADLAYTLQLGREPMDERLALVASSVEDLVAKLGAHAAGNEHVEDVFCGQVKRNKEAMGVFAADEDMASTIEAWVAKGKYAKLLELWVKGLAFDWSRLYGEDKPRRISLPSYPFARERYWVPEGGKARVVPQGGAALLHPLVHRNTSDLSGPQFSSTLDADAFYLADHVVQGRRMLPGVAYLEMALAGVMQASSLQDPSTVRLANVVWLRPMVADSASLEVNLGLYPEDNGDIAFEVSSGEHVHSQGVALVGQASAAARIDIAALQAQFTHQMTAQECYALFNSAGLAYGPRFQALQGLYIGDGQVLAKLAMPAGADGAYILNPSVMDGALQASIGLFSGDGKAAVPFALGELAVLGPCTANMWALVRRSAGVQAHDKVQKLDIDVCDDDGKVCVQIAGLSLRVMASAPASGDDVGVLLLQPEWISQEVAVSDLPAYAQRVVVLCGVEGIENVEVAGARCMNLGLPVDGVADFYQHSTQALLLELQALLAPKPGAPVLVQVVVPALGQEQVLAGLAGMLKTARQENPKLLGQLIAVENGETSVALTAKLQANARSAQDQHVRYEDGARRVAGWRDLPATAAKMPWKAGGVYLITGGAGGLGMIFAREIAKHAPGAVLVVTGRSALDAGRQALLDELHVLGARTLYRAVDVGDADAVAGLVDGIVADFGALDGIVHSAGVTRDSFIVRKTAQECEAVLGPKVHGLVNLDLASRELKLDFLLCFSSGAGALGNVGQADYAAANAFMDAYAAYRNSLVVLEQRHGQTLSLNWPLWAEGGMGIDAATAQRMTNSTGMVPMKTGSGIDAMYRALESGEAQVMVLEGVLAKMRGVLSLAGSTAEAQGAPAAAPAVDAGGLQEKVKAMLVRLVSKLLKVNADDIDGDAELSDYGFDSISLTEFGNTLNQEYQVELAPTIFFEYPTINQFARYLVAEHQAAFGARLGGHKAPAPGARPQVAIAQPEATVVQKRRRGRFVQQATVAAPAAVLNEAVAIVGISGQFPMAADLDAFWDNLLEGRSCISEIPKDRWDWQACYGDPAREANKTNIKWGGFIDGVGDFDPLFFGISPKEAELMDPQQRLLMIHVWKAIEDAGYSAASLSGTDTALFVGTGSTGYAGLVAQAKVAIEGYSATGAVPSVGPNRMSYLLNIHGASEPIETACSSALVALRRGVQAIENGDSQMAIVGGVNTIVTPDGHISFSKAGMLSEDGRCKTFSAQADGYVRGEGVGMLVLKKLSAAEKDGDHIYGLIRGSAENHGGRASSLTAPNPKAQAALLVAAYKKANIDPRSVSYIEAHGTGTGLGDPVEINGLKSAFKDMYLASGGADVQAPHCGLGSVKTNIGHLELAAGAAGVIKVLMQLKHKTLVKTLHCDTVNPYIDLKDSPFYLVRETQEWKPLADAQGNALPRRAGVSSFGFGGVNAHVVIEEYIAPVQAVPENTGPALIVLSAKNSERLQGQVQQLLTWLEGQGSDVDLAAVACTLQMGREPMEVRLALIAESTEELVAKLQAHAAGDDGVADVFRGQVKRNRDSLDVFAADDDMAKAIDAWVAKGKYARLLELWVKGLVFDWSKLYGEHRPRRISLPTYPFARVRCWVPTPAIPDMAPVYAPAVRKAGHANKFDEALFAKLFDEIDSDALSVEAALLALDKKLISATEQ